MYYSIFEANNLGNYLPREIEGFEPKTLIGYFAAIHPKTTELDASRIALFYLNEDELRKAFQYIPKGITFLDLSSNTLRFANWGIPTLLSCIPQSVEHLVLHSETLESHILKSENWLDSGNLPVLPNIKILTLSYSEFLELPIKKALKFSHCFPNLTELRLLDDEGRPQLLTPAELSLVSAYGFTKRKHTLCLNNLTPPLTPRSSSNVVYDDDIDATLAQIVALPPAATSVSMEIKRGLPSESLALLLQALPESITRLDWYSSTPWGKDVVLIPGSITTLRDCLNTIINGGGGLASHIKALELSYLQYFCTYPQYDKNLLPHIEKLTFVWSEFLALSTKEAITLANFFPNLKELIVLDDSGKPKQFSIAEINILRAHGFPTPLSYKIPSLVTQCSMFVTHASTGDRLEAVDQPKLPVNDPFELTTIVIT